MTDGPATAHRRRRRRRNLRSRNPSIPPPGPGARTEPLVPNDHATSLRRRRHLRAAASPSRAVRAGTPRVRRHRLPDVHGNSKLTS